MNSIRTCLLEPVDLHNEDALWTTAQAAVVLNRSERSVRRLVQQGTIAGHKIRGKFGGEWRIMPFALEQHKHDSEPGHDHDSSSGCGGSIDYACDTSADPSEVAEKQSSQQSDDKQNPEQVQTQTQTKAEAPCANRMASVVMPEPSIWTNLLNFFQALFFWTARQDKLSKHST
jgi:excisionase family DNA binding protein